MLKIMCRHIIVLFHGVMKKIISCNRENKKKFKNKRKIGKIIPKSNLKIETNTLGSKDCSSSKIVFCFYCS